MFQVCMASEARGVLRVGMMVQRTAIEYAGALFAEALEGTFGQSGFVVVYGPDGEQVVNAQVWHPVREVH